MRALPLLLALPLLCLLSSPAASAPAEFTRHDSLAAAAQSIQAGKIIRLQMLDPEQRRFEGALERFAADTLHVSDGRLGARAVPIDSLGGLWVRGNAGPRTAVILGVVAFFGTFIALSAIESSLESGVGFGGSSSDDDDELLTSAAAGLAGVVVGYGLGSTIDTWDRKYPKQKKTGPSRQ